MEEKILDPIEDLGHPKDGDLTGDANAVNIRTSHEVGDRMTELIKRGAGAQGAFNKAIDDMVAERVGNNS